LNGLSAHRQVNQLSHHPTETVEQWDPIDENPSRYARSNERTIEQVVLFVMDADDGQGIRQYDRADVILAGVSRSGKTPTCVYLALRYGVFAANYLFTEEDLESGRLPDALFPYREKLYGYRELPLNHTTNGWHQGVRRRSRYRRLIDNGPTDARRRQFFTGH
jgi:hypothetical protein